MFFYLIYFAKNHLLLTLNVIICTGYIISVYFNNEESKSCLSCTRYPFWSFFMPLPNIIKIFQTIKKLWSAQEFGLEIRSGERTRIRIEQELSFLYMTLICPYQILSNYLKLYESYGLHKNIRLQGRSVHYEESESCLSCR